MNPGTPAADVRVRRFELRRDLDAALAERLRGAATRGAPGAVMLAGGTTPQPAFALLAAHPLRAAPGLHVLYSDERYVPSTSDASNYHLSLPLLAALGLPARQVLRVQTELPLEAAAQAYEERLQSLLSEQLPVRLGILGLGADGHTASLFKPADLAAARGRLAVAVQRPDGRAAVSVTPEWLAQIAEILFVVAGADKRSALARLAARDPTLIAWQAVERCARVEVWADGAAWEARD
ncbi:MAG TPA: 6-phosphogluconolactonase [Steroidobacteraceae bacterium]|jgi:6-phosphogluconolactonase|nr:6-phosphogluconolactonase [Steroidobacteraceae bacterium]